RPLQRAGRRGAVLRARPLRQPPRRRGGVVHAAPARHPARPAPRHDRRQPRGDAHRRAGGHGRYRAAAAPDAAGAGTGRPEVSDELAGLIRRSSRAQKMAPAQAPPPRSLVLSGIDWRTYTRLLRIFADRPSIRLTYDRGELEIMSPLSEHEGDAYL